MGWIEMVLVNIGSPERFWVNICDFSAKQRFLNIYHGLFFSESRFLEKQNRRRQDNLPPREMFDARCYLHTNFSTYEYSF